MKLWIFVPIALTIAALAIWHPAPKPAALLASSSAPAHPRSHPPSASATSVVLVYVVGAVNHPGVFALAAGSRGQDAIARAGGFTSDANRAGVNLAELLQDGEQLTAPLVGEPTPRASRSRSGKAASRRKRSSLTTHPPQTIDLNTADAQTLSELPGVGATLADRIVRYRVLNGAFSNLDELADVAGMTDRRIQQAAPYLSIR
ncbi:MAG: ComEA family DNA-binding protein [Candidatus Baltobacteraceae bacterium]